MISRRSFVAMLPAAGALASPAFAQGTGQSSGQASRKLRIGFQKGEPSLVAAKQNKAIEQAVAPLGVDVQWVEFEFGLPIMEAMRVGSIDFGGVGDAPPIFAQAAHADLLYVGAEPSGASAVLVPPGSSLQTLADLKGKKLAFARGSSAHNLAVAAVQKAGLAWTDIEPVALAPSDAAAAFERKAIDAWTIWDPYFALYETRAGVRVLAKSTDIIAQSSYYISSRTYTVANPEIVSAAVDALAKTEEWAKAHQLEVAKMLGEGTGIPVEAQLRAVRRNPFRVDPMDDTYAQSQQDEADRFHSIGVLPVAINVRTQIWKSKP